MPPFIVTQPGNSLQGAVAKGCAVLRLFTSLGIHVHGFTPFWVKTAMPMTPTFRVLPWRMFA